MSTSLLALDQGTSSSRAIVFDAEGCILGQAQQALTQHFPQPGWVEHDPIEIWSTQLGTARAALADAGVAAAQLAGIGIANQRETTLLWDRRTGEPLHRAIVWQDRRTEPLCATLRSQGLGRLIENSTGLVIDPYFSATKLRWLLDNLPDARSRALNGELAFGTVDSWLLWQLTGGPRGGVHATDISNASRTMLFNIGTSTWDTTLLSLLDIPASLLPVVHPSSHVFGHTTPDCLGAAVPIGGMAGDQQSALFGQACFTPGLAKNTYGTGCFALMHTGAQRHASRNGLLSTRAAQAGPEAGHALEGSVFMGGAVVQWLRDGLGLIQHSNEVQALAEQVPDSGGVTVVPAFTGLGAPYWRPEARAAILGLSRGSTRAHIARAALESIAYQSTALLQAMARDMGKPLSELRVDGGACVNNLLMQCQADLLGIPVVRPAVIETTALGAAYLAGLACGVHAGLPQLAALWNVERVFLPSLAPAQAAARMAEWEQAVLRVIRDPA